MNNHPTARVADVPVPRDATLLTPAWVTRALSRCHPGIEVGNVAVVHIDRGTTTRALLDLDYRTGAGPAGVFVKMQGGAQHRATMGVLDMLNHEARAYRRFDPMPLEAPTVYATGLDRLRLQSVVVMEDLTPRGVVLNDARRTVPAERAAGVIDDLAAMHARFWDLDAEVDARLRHIPVRRFFPGWAIVSAAGNGRFVRERAELLERICAPHLRSARALTRRWGAGMADIRRGPRTLLHGDSHVGNTYELAGGRFGFLDWQLISRGSWSHDVSYFLTSALSIPDRRLHERELITRYTEQLAAHGITELGADQAWEGHRRAQAYGLPCWTATAGYADYQQDDLAVTTAERFAAAYADLDTDSALKAAGLL
jgi:hypothetical protein